MALVEVCDPRTGAEVIENYKRVTAYWRGLCLPAPNAPPPVVLSLEESAPLPCPTPVVSDDESGPASDPVAASTLTIRQVQDVVCEYFGIHRDELLSKSRKAPVVFRRQMAMYLCRVVPEKSYPEIGRRFGGMDHSTAINAVRKIERMVAANEGVREQVERLRLRLAGSR